jgi:hypothetical protein
MVKRPVLSPRQDCKRRVTKPMSRAGWSSEVHADQARQESQQPQVDIHRILALLPYISVTDHRQSVRGAEVKIECNTWVDRSYLEEIESALKPLGEHMRILDKE